MVREGVLICTHASRDEEQESSCQAFCRPGSHIYSETARWWNCSEGDEISIRNPQRRIVAESIATAPAQHCRFADILADVFRDNPCPALRSGGQAAYEAMEYAYDGDLTPDQPVVLIHHRVTRIVS